MGKANRDRRRAKLKDRERERKRRDMRGERAATGPHPGTHPRGGPGRRQQTASGWSPDPVEAVSHLVTQGLAAHRESDSDTFARCVAELAPPPGAARAPGWQRIVGRTIWGILAATVSATWKCGWQPAELVRHAERELSARHARLVTDVVAGEMRQYATARVDERWAAQLTALGAAAWWDRDDDYLELWGLREGLGRAGAVGCALDALHVMMHMPKLEVLLPLPGTARPSAPAAGGSAPKRPVDERMLQRVRALLAKAESTEFPEEAEALTARAQELMARHSIDEAVLAAAAAEQSGRRAPGEASARRLFVDNPYELPKALLLDVIARANRCRAIFAKNLGLSTVIGFDADLDAVEMLFTSLLVQATTAMLAAGPRQDAYGRSRTRSFRQSFLSSYAQRIGERLSEATGAAEQAAAADSPGTNLLPVLAARSRVVDEAFEAMFPETTQFFAGAASNSEGWYAGRAAADLASLQHRREVTGDAA